MYRRNIYTNVLGVPLLSEYQSHFPPLGEPSPQYLGADILSALAKAKMQEEINRQVLEEKNKSRLSQLTEALKPNPLLSNQRCTCNLCPYCGKPR